MSEAKFTKGPWAAQFNFAGRDGIGDVWQINAEHHAVCTTQFCYAEYTEYNAHLIASAPDMYEALEALIHQHKCGGDMNAPSRKKYYDAGAAALSKARGEEIK